jgi:hypothetical protein
MDNSYTAPNDADLSISELSLAEKPSIQEQQPFSLLARPRPRPTRDLVQTTSETNDNDDQNQDTKPAPEGQEVAPREEEDKDDAPDEVDEATTTAAAKQSVTRAREERLKQDLFVLRKLNAAFAAYNDALEETRSSTDVSVEWSIAFIMSMGLRVCDAQPTACLRTAQRDKRPPQQIHGHSRKIRGYYSTHIRRKMERRR